MNTERCANLLMLLIRKNRSLTPIEKEALFYAWKTLSPHCGICKHHKFIRQQRRIRHDTYEEEYINIYKCYNMESEYRRNYTKGFITCDHFEANDMDFEEWKTSEDIENGTWGDAEEWSKN